MKRSLALTLAIVMLAAVLAGCAAAPATAKRGSADTPISPKITLTSSDAADAAAWLTARLDAIPDRVVLGTDADGYGVDVAALEDDGYFIRALGDEVAIFAKTADGLDRAVRKYAKTVSAGKSAADVTYHEGARIEELRLAGNDISTYAICVECRSEYFTREVTNNTAAVMSRLLAKACGFAPEVGGEAEHYIILRQIDDPDFHESSYRYRFVGGDLLIEFVELFGSKNGAIMFLQDELGWADLFSGFDELAETDLVDVPADLDVTVHPLFEGGITQTTAAAFKTHGASLAAESYFMFHRAYRIPSASHALGLRWATDYGYEQTNHLPCLTDDDVFEDTADEIAAYVQSRLDAGEVLGEGMAHIDLGADDVNKFCECRNCKAMYLKNGKTWAAPTVYFANRIEEELDSRGYDGIKYSIFAYAGSNPPPENIAPNDDIYVTLVLHDACDVHFIDGSQCGDGNVESWFMLEVNRNYTGGERRILNNEDWSAWIRGWHELGAHLYIRPATLINVLEPFDTMYNIYENMHFYAENGVMSMYNETYAADGLDFNYIVHELYQIAFIRPDMSRADFYAEYRRLLEKYYGDGWEGVFAFAENLREAEYAGTCRSAWASDIGRYDYALFDSLWDETLAGLESAERNANSRRQEHLCKMIKCAAIYMECLTSYFYAYNAGDEATLARDRAMWDGMISLLLEAGYRIINGEDAVGTWQGVKSGRRLELPPEVIGQWGSPYYFPLRESLDDEAWIEWGTNYREVLAVWGVTENIRLRPSEYSEKN